MSEDQFQVLGQISRIKSLSKSSNGQEDREQTLSSLQAHQQDIDVNSSMKSNEEDTYIDDDNIMESIKLPPNVKIKNFGNPKSNKHEKSKQKEQQQQQVRAKEREKEREREREREKEIEKEREREKEKERQRQREMEREKEREKSKQVKISSSSQSQPQPQSSAQSPPQSDTENTQQFMKQNNLNEQKNKNMISKQNSIDSLQKPKAIKEKSPQKPNTKAPEDENIVDFSRSMYGQRLNKNQNKSKQKQNSKMENSPLKPSKYPQDLNQVNAFQSIHMQKIQDSTIKDKNTPKDVYFDTFVDNADHQNNMLLWKHDKDKISLRITSDTYMEIVELFLREQVMLPLISNEQFKSEFINSFMKKYTKFLNDFYQEQFKEVLKKVKQTHQQTKNKEYPSTASTPKASQTTAGFIKSFLPFFKSQNYSKPQMANNYLRNKIRVLDMIISQKRSQKQNTDAEQHTLRTIQQQICMLQMLISFENSQNYCKKNSNDGGLDSKVWKERGKNLNIQFKEYLKSLQRNNEVIIQI